MHYIQFQLPLTTMWADASFCLLEWWEEKEALTELLHYTFKVATAQTSGLFNLVFSWQLVFSVCKHLFIDEPIQVITEPIEPRARPLGLGSKTRYPSNMQCMLHKNLTQFMQSLSCVHQNQVRKKKALLARGQQALLCWPLVKIKNAYSTVFLPVFNTAVVCDYSVMVLLHSCLIKSVFLCQRCTYWSITVEDGKKSWHST